MLSGFFVAISSGRKLFRSILPIAALAAVAGCSSDKFNNCPSVSSLIETSIGTVFKSGATTDPSNIVYTVEITNVRASCTVDKPAINSSSDINIAFRATRAPSGAAVHYKVPYFVAISQGDRILAKRQFNVEFGFDPGQTATVFSDNVKSAEVTAGKEKKTYEYLILVGLQLSKAQLDYNRASGRLNP